MSFTEESANGRYDRFNEAKINLEVWKSRIKEIYKYVAPVRDDYDVPINQPAKLNESSKGNSISRSVFDSTAIVAAKDFANNLQLTLVPPLTNWITLKVSSRIQGVKLNAKTKTNANKELQDITDTLFENLRASNFDLAFNEIAKDLTVGTGILLINESEGRAPFSFSAVDINSAVFETGNDDSIQSVWQNQLLSRRKIKQLWPNARFPAGFLKDLSENPNKTAEIVIGAIVYPENPSNRRCFHYVQLVDSKTDIFTEWRDISPYMGIRYEKRSGESFGRGVADTAFPSIKTLNKVAEYMLRSAKYLGLPIFTVNQGATINPYILDIVPGARIPVNPDVGGDPLKSVDVKTNPQYLQQILLDLRAQVQGQIFSDPLGPVQEVKGRSATEMQARLEKFIRENGAASGRLAQELIFPVLDRCLRIFQFRHLFQQ